MVLRILQQQDDSSTCASADAMLDHVERLIFRRYAVDRQHYVPRSDPGSYRRIVGYRRDNRLMRLAILLNVHADAAEIATLQLFIERADLAGGKVNGVRIVERA